MTSGFTSPNVWLISLKAIEIRPITSSHFKVANNAPSTLFNHPSITSFITFSNNLPKRTRSMMTIMNINAKAAILRTCSEHVMYCASHLHTNPANLADAHTPRISEIIEMACEINPFMIPCIMAGIRHIRIYYP